MHGGEQQLALAAVEVHLAFEECGLQQAAPAQPVYLDVGGTRHQALKQRHLASPHVHILQGGQHGQGPAFRVCWGWGMGEEGSHRVGWGARKEQKHTGQGRHTYTHAHTERQTQRERCIWFLWMQGKPTHPARMARSS